MVQQLALQALAVAQDMKPVAMKPAARRLAAGQWQLEQELVLNRQPQAMGRAMKPVVGRLLAVRWQAAMTQSSRLGF